MAMTINTNIAAMNAQRMLGVTQGKLSTALQRLSSGLRINSAKDDAAGLAISTRMTSQVRGLNQAARNANDGISLAQTAEGALSEATNLLQRIRELAVQAVNDTNTAGDRASMQSEVSQLLQELDRIAETTQFNGKNLLDGSLLGATFQVGANAGTNQTISFDISSAMAVDMSAIGTTISAPNGTAVESTAVTAALAVGDLSINGTAIGVTTADAASLAAAIQAADSNVTATAQNVQTINFADFTLAGADAILTAAGPVTGALNTSLVINGVTVAAVDEHDTSTAAAIAAAIVTASIDGSSTGAAITATVANSNTLDTMKTFTEVTFDSTVTGTEVSEIAGDDLVINGFAVGASGATDGNLAALIAGAITDAVTDSSVTAAAGTSLTGTIAFTALSGGDITDVYSLSVESGGVTTNLFTTEDASAGVSTAEFLDVLQAASVVTDGDAIEGVFAGGSGVAWASANGTQVTFSTTDGADIFISQTWVDGGGNDDAAGGLTGGDGNLVANTVGGGNGSYTETDTTYGNVVLTRTGNILIAAGAGDITNSGLLASQSDDRSYSLTVEGVVLFDDDQNGVTRAEVDAAIVTNASALAAAGVTLSDSSAVGVDLHFIKTDGSDLEIIQTGGADVQTDNEGFAAILDDGTTVTTYGVISLTSAGDITIVADPNGSGLVSDDSAENTVDGSYVLLVDGSTVDLTTARIDRSVTQAEMIAALDGLANYSAVAGATTGDIVITKTDDATNFTITETSNVDFDDGQDNTAVGLADVAAVQTTYRGNISLDSTSEIVFAGSTAAMAAAGLDSTGNNTTTIDLVSVATRLGANTAISSIDMALGEIAEIRGEMGAVQNRFESTIANLQSIAENISAARARILDADFAIETANLTKAQIMQQAGVAMLAQANMLPQMVLSLLQ